MSKRHFTTIQANNTRKRYTKLIWPIENTKTNPNMHARTSSHLDIPYFFASALTASNSAGISSLKNRFGTSPLVRMLFTSSKNVSITIYVSSNKNTVGLFAPPACLYSTFKSSRNSIVR